MQNNVKIISCDWNDNDGTYDVVLELDGVQVQGEGIDWFDEEGVHEGLFEEWLEMAEDGEDGFTVLEQ